MAPGTLGLRSKARHDEYGHRASVASARTYIVPLQNDRAAHVLQAELAQIEFALVRVLLRIRRRVPRFDLVLAPVRAAAARGEPHNGAPGRCLPARGTLPNSITSMRRVVSDAWSAAIICRARACACLNSATSALVTVRRSFALAAAPSVRLVSSTSSSGASGLSSASTAAPAKVTVCVASARRSPPLAASPRRRFSVRPAVGRSRRRRGAGWCVACWSALPTCWPVALQAAHIHGPSGGLDIGGRRQNVWKPLSQRSHSSSCSCTTMAAGSVRACWRPTGITTTSGTVTAIHRHLHHRFRPYITHQHRHELCMTSLHHHL